MAAQVVRDGVAFFRRARSLAADPRVKFIFGRAAEQYEKALQALERLPGAKGKTKGPPVFPFEEYERMECTVCGRVVKGREPPETCPGCGAARYAFERDIRLDDGWNLVARTTKESLAIVRKIAQGPVDTDTKVSIADAIAIHKELLEEAKEERARIVAAP